MAEKLGLPEDRAMWRRLAGLRPADGAGQAQVLPSYQDLAAWIDGRLKGARAERVEAALAAHPALLETVLDVQAVGRPQEAVPDRLVVRARALVSPQVTGADTPVRWFGSWRLGVQWSAVAAMTVAISVGGFNLGGSTQAALGGQRQWGHMLSAVLDSLDEPDLPGYSEAGSDQ